MSNLDLARGKQKPLGVGAGGCPHGGGGAGTSHILLGRQREGGGFFLQRKRLSESPGTQSGLGLSCGFSTIISGFRSSKRESNAHKKVRKEKQTVSVVT